MPFYIGENKIIDRYLGDKLLEAAYIGDKKVYDPYTEITGYLPMIFKSRATVALKNYRIHGTSAGAGVETESGEPTGYKLPLTVESGAQSQDIPIYIGDSKLGTEEYVDYGEQKVYKRTENDFPFAEKGTFAFGNDGNIISDGKGKFVVSMPSTIPADTRSELIPLNKPYTIPQSVDTGGEFTLYLGNNVEKGNLNLVFYDADGVLIENWRCTPTWRRSTAYSQMTEKTIAYIGVLNGGNISGKVELTPMFSKNADLTSYVPYLQPTDPPVPLPSISTYQGENTLYSTETLGEATIKGRINELPTQQSDN